MWTPTKEEIAEILEKHHKWLHNEKGGKRADLRRANLAGADLAGADLIDADLAGADLRDADLAGAYLRGADLRDADLSGANLTGANLAGAYLRDADLRRARNAELALAMTEIVPREGEFYGWKKLENDVIAKLLIPQDSKRSNATTRKCRCSKAYVEDLVDVHGHHIDSAFSRGIGDAIPIKYTAGEMVEANSWDDDRLNECAPGIHFFLTREEAEAWR